MVLLHQKAVRPPTRGIHHGAIGTLFEDAGRDLTHLKTPPGAWRWRIGFLPRPVDRPFVANNLTAIRIHLHRDHGIVKALAVVVEVHLDVDKGVAQALPVQGLVGIGHVHPFLQEPAGQPPGNLGLGSHLDRVILRLTPDIGGTSFKRVAGEVIIGQDAERRNNILGEILVLIVTEHQDEIRVELVDVVLELVKGRDQPGPMFAVGRSPFIFAVLSRTPSGQFWGSCSASGTRGSFARVRKKGHVPASSGRIMAGQWVEPMPLSLPLHLSLTYTYT